MLSKNQKGFAHFLIPLFLLIIIGAIGFVVFKKIHSNVSGIGGPSAVQAAKMPDCNGKELLRQSPVDPGEISQIIPLGNLAPPGHVLPTYHMYYNYLHTGQGTQKHSVRTKLIVPADMVVTQMMKMDNADHDPAYESYRIDFAICKQVTGYFILVQELNDKLAAAMQAPYDRTQESDVGGNKKTHNWYKVVHVQLKAGELLGYAGGQVGYPDGLDMAIIDSRSPQPSLANPKRWNKSDMHYVCSLDYYPTSLSTQLYNKLANFNGNKATGGKNACGTVYQDLPGSAQGVWVTADSMGDEILWDVHSLAALVHSNFDKSQGAISLGSKANLAGLNSQYVSLFSPKTSGRVDLDFNLVQPGSGIFCYEVDNGSGQPSSKSTILLELNKDKLKLGPGPQDVCGVGPWVFTKAIEYIR